MSVLSSMPDSASTSSSRWASPPASRGRRCRTRRSWVAAFMRAPRRRRGRRLAVGVAGQRRRRQRAILLHQRLRRQRARGAAEGEQPAGEDLVPPDDEAPLPRLSRHGRAEAGGGVDGAGGAGELHRGLLGVAVAQLPGVARARVLGEHEAGRHHVVLGLQPLPVHGDVAHAADAKVAQRVALGVAAGEVPVAAEEEEAVGLDGAARRGVAVHGVVAELHPLAGAQRLAQLGEGGRIGGGARARDHRVAGRRGGIHRQVEGQLAEGGRRASAESAGSPSWRARAAASTTSASSSGSKASVWSAR